MGKNIYNILRGNGFTNKVLYMTKLQSLVNKIFRKDLYHNKECSTWVESIINGIKYEIYEIDYWYCQLRVDGDVIFDKRRFGNDELLSLIPSENKN